MRYPLGRRHEEPQLSALTDRGPASEEPDLRGMTLVESATLLRAGLTKKTLKKLGRCYASVKYDTLSNLMRGALGAILQKKGDMQRAVDCEKGVADWLE